MTAKADYSRQEFLGLDSADRLRACRVAIVGLGGGGSHIAQQLAHVGVGEFRLLDPQEIEASNLNRLIGATQADVDARSLKVEICKRTILGIRPTAKVEAVDAKWQSRDDLLRDAHAIFGCVDGYRQRLYLETAARKFGIPYFDIGMDVTRLSDDCYAVAGQMILSLPRGPCMRCIGFLTDARLAKEENHYGHAGINPQVVWTNGTLASLAVGSFVRTVCPWFKFQSEYEWLELDGNEQLISRSEQPRYAIKGPCTHFNENDLGDPLFAL